MLHRKLLEVLQQLNHQEQKRLRQFLESPYFNHGVHATSILRLYDLILRHRANEQHPALAKQAVFNLFFPGQLFREKQKGPLDDLTTLLFHLVQQFIAQRELERDKGAGFEHLALARFYRKSAAEDRFWQAMQSARKAQETSPYRDDRYYYDQFRIEEEELAFRGLYNSFEDDANLKNAQENLDKYYGIVKLEFQCYQQNQQLMAQVEESPSALLAEAVQALSEEGGLLDLPITRIYRQIIKLLKGQEPDSALDDLHRLLEKYKAQIDPEKFKNLKAYYRVLWVRRYSKKGDAYTQRRSFEIYREHLEQGYFYFDSQIPAHNFRNLVAFALKLGQLDWVKNFLETHPPERISGTRYPAEVHSLNMADYLFSLKKYEEAADHLVYRNFENPAFNILADVLLIKIYYETRNDLLESRMKALDQKIRRSRMNRRIKNRYYNFLKKLSQIIKYGWQPGTPRFDRVVAQIRDTQEMVAREWLLEKLHANETA